MQNIRYLFRPTLTQSDVDDRSRAPQTNHKSVSSLSLVVDAATREVASHSLAHLKEAREASQK